MDRIKSRLATAGKNKRSNLKTLQQKLSKMKHSEKKGLKNKRSNKGKSLLPVRQYWVVYYMCNWSPQRDGGGNRIFEKVVVRKFPKLVKFINTQTQEVR